VRAEGAGSRDRPGRAGVVFGYLTESANLRGRRFLPLLAVAVIGSTSILSADPDSPVRIEPAVEVVPANHLKFYLHFPESMERGHVFRYLRLVEIDEAGKELAEVPEPFREVELWDETFTRMTLWFHPGRQKPGVNLNVEIGPILEEGRRYRLEISDEWKTESGDHFEGSSTHEFVAGPLDDKQPDPANWNIFEITRMHIVAVKPNEVLDPESAKKRIHAFVDGEPRKVSFVNGLIHIDVNRTGWKSGRLIIDPRLEDLAGNSVVRPFNLDLEADSKSIEITDPIEIEFTRPIPLVSPFALP